MFFINLFSFDVQVTRNHIMANMTPSVLEEKRGKLNVIVTLEEVCGTVMAMHSFKAPGSDGFQAFFYKKFWSTVGEDLHQMVAKGFQEGCSDPALLDTLLVLIPKVF